LTVVDRQTFYWGSIPDGISPPCRGVYPAAEFTFLVDEPTQTVFFLYGVDLNTLKTSPSYVMMAATSP